MMLAGGILAGCNSGAAPVENEEPPKEEVTEQTEGNEGSEQAEAPAIEETATAKQVVAYKAMMDEAGKAKEGNPVDWDLVSTTYTNDLQAAVAEKSGEFDQAIQAGIQAGTNGELDPYVAKQIIDKTTQSYFYAKQKSLHKDVAAAMEAGNELEAQTAFSELKHLAEEVLIPTAAKRDSYYELTAEDSMEVNINTGLSVQEEALNTGNVDNYKIYTQLTDKTAYRSYYLAAQSYAEKIEKAVAEGETDLVTLQIKQAEAWGFFQAIKGSLSGGNEEAATKLNELFSLNVTDPTTIKAQEVKDLFAKAFVGKITSYHKKAPAAVEEGDIPTALVKALEGNVFMKDIELYIVEELGEEKSAELFAAAEQWYTAIENGDLEEAAPLSEQVVTTLEELVQ